MLRNIDLLESVTKCAPIINCLESVQQSQQLIYCLGTQRVGQLGYHAHLAAKPDDEAANIRQRHPEEQDLELGQSCGRRQKLLLAKSPAANPMKPLEQNTSEIVLVNS